MIWYPVSYYNSKILAIKSKKSPLTHVIFLVSETDPEHIIHAGNHRLCLLQENDVSQIKLAIMIKQRLINVLLNNFRCCRLSLSYSLWKRFGNANVHTSSIVPRFECISNLQLSHHINESYLPWFSDPQVIAVFKATWSLQVITYKCRELIDQVIGLWEPWHLAVCLAVRTQ